MGQLNFLFGVAGFCFFAYLFWGHNRPLAYALLAFAFLAPVAGRYFGW